MANKNVNEELIDACFDGDMEKVQYYLHSPKLKKHANLDYERAMAVRVAIDKRHPEIAEYLLNQDFDWKPYLDEILKDFCGYHNFKEVMSLYENNENFRPNFNAYNGDILKVIIESQNMEMIRFVFTNDNINPEVHIDNDKLFKSAYKVAETRKEIKVMKYLVEEVEITKTPEIKKLLSEKFPPFFHEEEKAFQELVIELFDIQKFYKKLNKVIPEKKNHKTKKKV